MIPDLDTLRSMAPTNVAGSRSRKGQERKNGPGVNATHWKSSFRTREWRHYTSHSTALEVEYADTGDSGSENLQRMLEILAPGDGDLVAFLECYFDESGTHDGSRVLSVAGYLFEKDECRKLDLGWKKALEDYNLPYFRMSACAHGNKPFDVLTPQQCIDIEKRMIALINNHALLGLSIIANEIDYGTWFPHPNPIGSAYTFCCWQILAGIGVWIKRNSFGGDISYFFESGHASQGEANALMTRIFKDQRLKEAYRYASHSFVDKEKVRPVQTADILAWHAATQIKRWLRDIPEKRKDFDALLSKPPHELLIANRKSVADVIAYHRLIRGFTVPGGITGQFGANLFWSPFDGSQGLTV